MPALPHLTEEQLAVVHHAAGHARVSAVAGSGKTATLVARVLRLLDQGVDPRRILVLMFNVSAREDFARRLEWSANGRYRVLPEVRTFHSLGLRITRSCVQRGVLPPCRLVTEEWRLRDAARAALEQALKLEGITESGELLSKERIENFIAFIDLVKADVVPAGDLLERLDFGQDVGHYKQAYGLFEQQRRQQEVRYYADLIHEPVMALRRDPSIADWLADHMEHICLDEYQDINEAQQQLVKALAGWRARVMAVGDVDQCVYEWRGARPEFMIDRFFSDFPDTTRYQLSHSFRFGHRLSLLADHAIARNQRRDDQLCLSAHGAPNTRVGRQVEAPGRQPLVEILDHWTGSGRHLSEAAVLVRLYSMSVPLELALLRRGIPYRLQGHDTLFRCPEIRSLLGHLQLAAGTLFAAGDAGVTIETMLRVPQLGFKKAQIQHIAEELLTHPEQSADVLQGLMTDTMGPGQRGRISRRTLLWAALPRLGDKANAWRVLQRVIEESELYEFFHWSSPTPDQTEERIQVCNSFLAFAREGDHSVADFLQLVAEMSAQTDSQGREALLITSIHRAKGLEWPLVILPGLAEGRFPYYRDADDADPVEDERRLFYVGCTRAQERLCLLHPLDPDYERQDTALGEHIPPPEQCSASRFLYEARVTLSDRVGAALDSGSKVALSAQTPALVNRYLAAIGSTLRVQDRHPGARDDSGVSPVWQNTTKRP